MGIYRYTLQQKTNVEDLVKQSSWFNLLITLFNISMLLFRSRPSHLKNQNSEEIIFEMQSMY